MIVCRKCGYHNGDTDGFCGSCGSFLEWTGEKVAPKATEEGTAPVREEAPDEPRRPSFLQRAYLTAVGGGTPDRPLSAAEAEAAKALRSGPAGPGFCSPCARPRIP